MVSRVLRRTKSKASARTPSLTGFEWRRNSGDWQAAGSSNVRDTDGPPPTLIAGTVMATEGTDDKYVQLKLIGAEAVAGADVAYEARALTTARPTVPSTPLRAGRAKPSALTITWERSSGATADGFETIAGASGTDWNDAEAPADGAVRYYRARVNAEGAAEVVTEAVPGSRMPPAGMVANFKATTDLVEHVVLTWDALAGATGYRLYRNNNLVAELSGSDVSWLDTSSNLAAGNTWSAPSEVVASTDRDDGVLISWRAPERPVGPDATYTIEAVTAAGPGARSAPVVGRRVAPPLISFEVEVPSGDSRIGVDTGSLDESWLHTAAAPATLVAGTATATRGDHMAHVRLQLSGHRATAVSGVYRVRGRFGSNLYTPASTNVTGARATRALTVKWQIETQANTWTDLPNATGADVTDTSAPINGAVRRYRARVESDDASPVVTAAVDGWRLAFTGLAAGAYHVCGLASDGSVWCWGTNESGQLGRGTTGLAEGTPMRVPNLTNVAQVTAGENHTCARMTSGVVRCWGNNQYGQLGDDSNTNRSSPVAVSNLQGVLGVRAGGLHTCARLSNNTVRCWGRNHAGQLGDGTLVDRWTPVGVKRATQWTGTNLAPTDLSDAVQIAAYYGHSCAIRSGGGTWCWGDSSVGQLGIQWQWGDNRVAVPVSGNHVAANLAQGPTANHACLVTTGDIAWCWGYDDPTGQQISGGTSIPWDTNTVQQPRSITNPATAGWAAVGVSGTCVAGVSGGIRCWGAAYGTGGLSVPVDAVAGLHAGQWGAYVLVNHRIWQVANPLIEIPFP
jgi:alpha-tubulin suppressor-like RCC1 family protein